MDNSNHIWITDLGREFYVCTECKVKVTRDLLHNNMVEDELYKVCLDRIVGPCQKKS